MTQHVCSAPQCGSSGVKGRLRCGNCRHVLPCIMVVRRKGAQAPGRSLTEKKHCSGTWFFQKRPRVAHMFNHGWWRLAVGGWWGLPVGGWRLVVGGNWQLVMGGWWRLAAVDGWWLVAIGGWRLVAVGGWWQFGG